MKAKQKKLTETLERLHKSYSGLHLSKINRTKFVVFFYKKKINVYFLHFVEKLCLNRTGSDCSIFFLSNVDVCVCMLNLIGNTASFFFDKTNRCASNRDCYIPVHVHY